MLHGLGSLMLIGRSVIGSKMNTITDPLAVRQSYLTSVEFGGSYHEVFIRDVYLSGCIVYVTVQALVGEPFVGGDRWPVHTNIRIVPLSEVIFTECSCFLPEQTCSVCRLCSTVPSGTDIPY